MFLGAGSIWITDKSFCPYSSDLWLLISLRRMSSLGTRCFQMRMTTSWSMMLSMRWNVRWSPLGREPMLVCSKYSPPKNKSPPSSCDNTKYIDIGANASAEGDEEEVEDGTETVNNIVYSFRLNQTGYDNKLYTKGLKSRCSNFTLSYFSLLTRNCSGSLP